jgi:two-component system response regulator HydG
MRGYGTWPMEHPTRSVHATAICYNAFLRGIVMLKVLLLLKSRQVADTIAPLIEGHDSDLFYRGSPLRLMKRRTYDLVVYEGDQNVLASVKQVDPRVEVLYIGTDPGEAVEAVRNGASAFFSRPLDVDKFRDTIQNLDKLFADKKETAQLEKILHSKYTFSGIIGKNPEILTIFNFLRRIAPYYRISTITGETGTGKEVIAKALHMLSPAGAGPFVVCNCGGLVETLIESELFGHKKGAFTGAISDKKGLFEAASGGTLFLDEIGDMPFSFQSHLLRVLQDGEYRPVGSSRALQADCRVIAATNRDLLTEVQDGRFREDLFYRITPLTVHMPPLRDRKDDIPLLSRFFLENFVGRTGKHVNGISLPAQTALMSYDWPGNVRELQSRVEEAAIMTTETFIRVTDLPAFIREAPNKQQAEPIALDDLISGHLRSVMGLCRGNQTRAAKLLGLSRRALQRKLDKYSISLK